MKTKFILVLSFLLMASSVSAVTVFDINPKCDDKGVFTMDIQAREIAGTLDVDDVSVSVYDKEKDKTIPIEGEWNTYDAIRPGVRATFTRTITTDEMVILTKGIHEATLAYPSFEGSGFDYLKKDFVCKGYVFSCSALDADILNCTNNNGVFSAFVKAKGFDNGKLSDVAKSFDRVNSIMYTFRTHERFSDINGVTSDRGGLPTNYFIYDVSDDVYEIRWNNGENYVFSMSYVFDNIDCSDYPDVKTGDTEECYIDPAALKALDPCLNGCTYEDICLFKGTRFLLKGDPSYCYTDKTIRSQKREKITCFFDYECDSNNCEKGSCSEQTKYVEGDLSADAPLKEKEAQAPKIGFFQKILDFVLGRRK